MHNLNINYKYLYKIRTIDFYLIIIGLLFTTISHLIAFKIIFLPLYKNVLLMSSSFTYTLVLTMGNLVRAYSTKLNAIKFLIIETIFMFLFINILKIVLFFPSPSWVNSSQFLDELSHLAFSIFKANFFGIYVVFILDIFLFSLLFNKLFHKLPLYPKFIFSSFISTFSLLAIYVYITDYWFLTSLYPDYWFIITNYNLLSNFIMIIFYSIIWSFVLSFIKKYLERS